MQLQQHFAQCNGGYMCLSCADMTTDTKYSSQILRYSPDTSRYSSQKLVGPTSRALQSWARQLCGGKRREGKLQETLITEIQEEMSQGIVPA